MQKISILILLIIIKIPLPGQDTTDTLRKAGFAAVPIVNYSNTIGASLGVMGQIFYKINRSDTISPSSYTGIFGMYTTNGSYFTAAFQQLYLRHDNWRIMLAGGIGNINFQYWQQLPIISGIYIGFNTEARFVMAKMERRIYRNLYAGISIMNSHTKTSFDVPDFIPDSLRFDNRNMNNLGYLINYDMREHQLNPYGGYNISFANEFYRTWMSSGNNFNKFELTYNHYFQLINERNILVTRIKAALSTGDVPFQGQNIVGMDDIRGYSSGKYRDNQVYAIQAEYRWRFYKKFGMVGFVGVATAVDKTGDIFQSPLLPGIGAGIRYMLIPSERINIGMDVAAGKDDWGLYFRIGEAFGR